MRDEARQIAQWLRDGGELEAANLLDKCSLNYMFVDVYFELGGERKFEMVDVNVEAPRQILKEKGSTQTPFIQQIESAIRECSQTMNAEIRDIYWVPKFDVSDKTTIEEQISTSLSQVDSEHIQRAWERALSRRNTDPEGAITAARTLMESVCKHILDKANISYSQNADLPQLYHLTAQHLQVAPNQYTETIIRQILGNCQSVVNGIAALRNKLGDAHGKSKAELLPPPIYAELAVNLAGTLAKFLISLQEESPKGMR